MFTVLSVTWVIQLSPHLTGYVYLFKEQSLIIQELTRLIQFCVSVELNYFLDLGKIDFNVMVIHMN